MTSQALALALALLVAVPVPALSRPDDDDPEPARPKPTAADLEAKLDTVKLTVLWKDSSVLDALNEVAVKSGLHFDFPQDFADFAAKRKASFDGYDVTAREALQVLAKTAGFTVHPDAETGRYRLKGDPTFPSRSALEETKLDIGWKNLAPEKALLEIEKRSRVKISLASNLKPRLKGRKLSYEAEGLRAREALEAIFNDPPSIPVTYRPLEHMSIEVAYAGAPETRADVDYTLDHCRMVADFRSADLGAVLEKVSGVTKLRCHLDPALAGKSVTYSAPESTVRAVLDGLAQAAGCGWKAEATGVRFFSKPLRPEGK